MQSAIDFKKIRQGIVRTVEMMTGATCVQENSEQTGNPRPALPYFGYNITTAAGKDGDDYDEYIGDGSTTIHNRGGQRRLIVSFHCYAQDTDEVLTLMTTLQGSFELQRAQENLRKYGIAVWTIGNVADFSSLLQTGYEARSQMDVNFGIASNLTEDVGAIETVEITPTIKDDGNVVVPTNGFEVEI